MHIDRDTPARFDISYNAEHRFMFVVATGFIRHTDQLAMSDQVDQFSKTVPSPTRLVLDYNQSDTTAFELMQFMKHMGSILKLMEEADCRELIIINNTTMWGRFVSQLSIHPQYGGRRMRLCLTYDDMLAYVIAHPLIP
ncbi:MAG: hypothetical protein ACOYLB_05530 [Phototrophicaceae bacterium]